MSAAENHDRDVRMAQTMACHAIVDMYATHQLPPLNWDITDQVRTTSVERLLGQVTGYSGDEEYRRGVLHRYAEVIGGEPYIQAEQFLLVDGVYEGVTVRVLTRIEGGAR